MEELVENLLKIYDEYEETLNSLQQSIEGDFMSSEIYKKIHTIKFRKKTRNHLKEKIIRKISEGKEISEQNFFNIITDLIGFRILLLFPQQFKMVHEYICHNPKWKLKEKPIAYTWDPETKDFFKNELGIKNVKQKDSYYTSLHYVINTYNKQNTPCCEIQVRTLLEESWGEVDHSFNYPHQNSNKYLQDSLKALAKIIVSATKLTEIIYNVGTQEDNL